MDTITLFDTTFQLFQSGEWHYAIPVKRELETTDKVLAFNEPAVQILHGNREEWSVDEVAEFFQLLRLELRHDH